MKAYFFIMRCPERNLILFFSEKNIAANFLSRIVYNKRLKYKIYLLKIQLPKLLKFISERAFFDNVLTIYAFGETAETLHQPIRFSIAASTYMAFPAKMPQLTI